MEDQTEQVSAPAKSVHLIPPFYKSKIFLFGLIIIFLTLISIGVYILQINKNTVSPKTIACTQEAKICPDGSYVSRTGPKCEFAPCPTLKTVETSNFKTYTNTKYGFQLKYPVRGVIQKENGSAEGECGNAIKENSEGILVDNFFQIKILDWQGSMDDYLIQQGAKNKYELKEIANSNADEAIEVLNLKKGLEVVSVGYPPLMYVTDIYKKDNKIFLFVHSPHPPNPTNPNGCLNPDDLDPFKYKKYRDLNWSIPTSFKFL